MFTFTRIAAVAPLVAACSTAVVDDTVEARFALASDRAFEDGLAACGPDVTRVLVMPTRGESLLEGDWFDRRAIERRHDLRRDDHTREIERALREHGFDVITYDGSTLGRLRRQHARLAGDGFVSLPTHVGSSLGAEVVVVPRLDFHYETAHDPTSDRWVSTLDWAADYTFVDTTVDLELASRWVDTRDVASLDRWAPRIAPLDASVLEAAAPIEQLSQRAGDRSAAPRHLP